MSIYSLDRTHKSFCQRVREERVSLGMTQQEAADKMQMTQPAYCDIENGRTTPTLRTMVRISKALKTPLSELLRSS